MIPLTPENSKADLATEISNIGRIVVNKCIEKIEKVDTNASLLFGPYDLAGNGGNGRKGNSHQQQLPGGGPQHKKKRLYSLGGNEPIRIHRGRLNRLKTVGTFDLTIEEVPRGDDEKAGSSSSTVLQEEGRSTSTSTAANSTSTELFTASGNPNSSSSCLNSPKEVHQFRKVNRKGGGKLARQHDCSGTSTESFDKVGVRSAIRGQQQQQVIRATTTTMKTSRSMAGGSSSVDTKTQSTDDDDPVTMISNQGTGKKLVTRTTEDSDEVRSPDEVFTKNKSILSNSSEFKARKSTFKKSKRITRTDSELMLDHAIMDGDSDKQPGRAGSLAKYSTDSNDSVLSPKFNADAITTDGSVGVMSSSMDNDDYDDEQADRFSLGTNLQRGYKSDGNSLDEIGLQRDPEALPPQKWMNHSLENCLMSTTSMDCIPAGKGGRESSVDSARGKSETPPPPQATQQQQQQVGKLFENPFSKFKKINKAWKCKRFSMSSGNVRKKTPDSDSNIVSPGTPNNDEGAELPGGGHGALSQRDVQDIISPTSVVSDSPKVTLSSSSIFSKLRQQALTATSSPSSSVASTRSHPRKLFSRLTSISNTELYKTANMRSARSGSNGQAKDISKSNSEINTASPFRKNTMRGQKHRQSVKALKLEKMKNNSAGCLAERKNAITEPQGMHNVSKVQSPLSEEFYNKTGSVRLSAVELFEKFCSSDFSGLYKHEEQESDPIMASHAAAPAKRYIYRKNSKLLKQRSEPRFTLSMHQQQFRFDEDVILSETYYEEEGLCMEEEEEEEMGEEYYEDEYFEEGEYDGEGDLEEEDEGLQGEEEERAVIIKGATVANCEEEEGCGGGNGVEQVLRRQSMTNKNNENMFLFERSHEDDDENQELDEIILMPETTCISAYPTTSSSTSTGAHLHRTEVIYDLNHLNSNENVTSTNHALLLSVIKDYVRNSGGETGEAEISMLDDKNGRRDFEVKCVNNEDILTIYRICSEENLTVTKAHMSQSKSDTQFVKSFQSVTRTPQSSYKRLRKHSQASSTRSGPTPLVTVELDDGGEIITYTRTGSNESDLGDLEEEDTVRFLCPDSFGSRLSLSLFDDLSLNFSLTLNENEKNNNGAVGSAGGRHLLAPDCDAEDFNLTSEGSVSECVDAQFRIVESLPSDEGGSSENATMNDEEVVAVVLDSQEQSLREESEEMVGGPEDVNRKSPMRRDDSNDEKKDPEKETPMNEVHGSLQEDSFSFPAEDTDSSIGIIMADKDVDGDEETEEQIAEEEEESEDPTKVSKFTNELQREFDMLFDIAATKPNVEVECDQNVVEPQHSGNSSMRIHKSNSGHGGSHKEQHPHHGSSLIASIRTRISSRHSMQNLEPYDPPPMMSDSMNTNNGNADYHALPGAEEVVMVMLGGEQQPKTSKSADHLHGGGIEDEIGVLNSNKKGLLSMAAAEANKKKGRSTLLVVGTAEQKDNGNNGRKSHKSLQQRDSVNEEDSEYVGCVHLLCSRFKKRKSLSMGNLEKSKCFPL